MTDEANNVPIHAAAVHEINTYYPSGNTTSNQRRKDRRLFDVY